MEQEANPWKAALRRFQGNNYGRLFPDDEFGRVLDPVNASSVRGTRYVLETLWSAKAAVESTSDFAASCVRRAIALGHDTDTTPAVVARLQRERKRTTQTVLAEAHINGAFDPKPMSPDCPRTQHTTKEALWLSQSATTHHLSIALGG